ncbi:hypothetical protein B0H11DRAFT_1192382 [Mycena galericulata]|nr:hypothetical protein B0H11DRAFT_1192382 [Mycena galericulata]
MRLRFVNHIPRPALIVNINCCQASCSAVNCYHSTCSPGLLLSAPRTPSRIRIMARRALYEEVQVGDVGYIRDGAFHRLFHAILPADDPSQTLEFLFYSSPSFRSSSPSESRYGVGVNGRALVKIIRVLTSSNSEGAAQWPTRLRRRRYDDAYSENSQLSTSAKANPTSGWEAQFQVARKACKTRRSD